MDHAVSLEGAAPARPAGDIDFDQQFSALFDAHFAVVFRVLDRMSGDPELAADVAQEAFIRLYRRGSEPDRPAAWLVSVALNLMRNALGKRRRRARLMSVVRGEGAHGDAAPLPGTSTEADAMRRSARAALDRLTKREQTLLLLHAEGYAYREIARVVGLSESSIGQLIARARSAFRRAYDQEEHAT